VGIYTFPVDLWKSMVWNMTVKYKQNQFRQAYYAIIEDTKHILQICFVKLVIKRYWSRGKNHVNEK